MYIFVSLISYLFLSFSSYNCPEKSRHRKRTLDNLSAAKLLEHAENLAKFLTRSWIQNEKWLALKEAVVLLVEALTTYAKYLRQKAKRMQEHHARIFLSDDKYTLKILPVNPVPLMKYNKLCSAVQNEDDTFVEVDRFAPDFRNRQERYRYMAELESGLPTKCVLLTYSVGGNITDYHFLWKTKNTEEETLLHSNKLLAEIKKEMPVFHPRALKRMFISRFGTFTNNTPKYVLRDIYKELTNDHSASHDLPTLELDLRLQEALDSQDPDLIVDLRSLNSDGSDRYAVFWEHMEKYINDMSAVHERRQTTVGYLAVALSTRDLIEQVTKLCPDGTPIPSISWVRYQFHPKNPRSVAARRFKKRFNLKLMVQQRLLRAWHPDAHYCAAYLKYLKEFAVLNRDRSLFVSLDDKHRLKIGEPGFPVAAVERGRRVVVSLDNTMQVADHDFTKSSIIPSGQFVVQIPESVDESFYAGDMFIGFKDAVLEQSSAMRHSAELYKTLVSEHA